MNKEPGKRIALTGKKGGFTTVSLNDYDELKKYKWHKDQADYARCEINGKNICIGRFLLKVTDPNLKIDHINHKRNDYRRSNLRVVTQAINNTNKSICKRKESSKYHGVFKHKYKTKYPFYVAFKREGKKIYLGKFANEIEAAEIRDMYIVHKCDSINLNFPEKLEEYQKREYKPFVTDKTKSSDYIGVSRNGKGWVARIRVSRIEYKILSSYDQEECAMAYDDYIVDNNIPAKKLNFPDENPNYNPNSVIKTGSIKIDENTVQLVMKDMTHKVIIDALDYDLVKNYICYVAVDEKDRPVVNICLPNNKIQLLSRYLTGLKDPLVFADHIDGNTLNNKRNNLRPSNWKKNGQNRRKSNKKDFTSKYIDIIRHRKSWRGVIMKEGNKIYHHTDKTEENAARRRDLFVIKNLKDDHYNLNFK